jgi:hypothetical protein
MKPSPALPPLAPALLAGMLLAAAPSAAQPGFVTGEMARLPGLVLDGDSTGLDLNRLAPGADTAQPSTLGRWNTAWQRRTAVRLQEWALRDSLALGLWFEGMEHSGGAVDPFAALSGCLDWSPRPGLRLHAVLSVLAGEPEPRQFPGNWGDVHAGNREAWLEFSRPWLRLRLGRQSLNTGPEAGRSLLLSGGNSLDGYTLELRHGASPAGWWFGAFHLALDDRLDGTILWNRYLAGHRLGYTRPGHWGLALGEAILYGTRNGGPSWQALNPLLVYHAVQMNGLEANTVFHGSGWWKATPALLLTGELLLDDFQLDDKTADDREPDEWALQLDARAALPADLTARAGYTRITQRTYNSKFGHQNWLYRGRLLAHPLGADADEWRLGLAWNGSPRLRPAYTLSVRRQGERTPLVPFDEPWLEPDAGSDYSEPFPTGEVRESLTHELALESGWGGWNLRLAWQHTKDEPLPGGSRGIEGMDVVQVELFGGMAGIRPFSK